MCLKYVTYWVPKTKAELLGWFKKQDITVKSGMKKDQLYAVYFSIRNKGL